MDFHTHIKQAAVFSLLVSLFIAFCAPVIGLVQTDIVYTMDDTYVNSSAGDANYDGVGLVINGSNTEAWFRFDLSDPTGYYVTGAALWAYVTSVAGNEQYSIHNADGTDYTEANLTYNSKPTYGGSLDNVQIGATGWFSWAITGTYSSGFSSGDTYIGYAIEGSDNVLIEDKENTLGTGNVPYLNLTMMIPEVDPLSPADDTSTYATIQTFQYSTSDVGDITNCSLIFDTHVNKTNTSAPENTSSSFTLPGIAVGSHTWSVRCYDSGREVYEMNTETRDLTVLASVEWYNPGSATPLDIGSAVVGGAEPSGSRQAYANNSNTNVDVSCASGDCSVITTNWSSRSISGGGTALVHFNCSTGTAGSYEADFDITSDQDASADTLTVNCSILAPDLRINSTNITFSDNSPAENQVVTISAGVYNDGTYDATNAVVRFYNGHYSTGTQIGSDHAINLSAGDSIVVQQDWTTTKGSFDIYAVVDPPVDTNGSIAETDESNNYAYSTISISMWTIFVGNVTGNLALQTENNETLLKWTVPDPTDSLVYVVDTDSNPDFNSLVAFGRNTSGAYMADDFAELDSDINTTSYDDSINSTFTQGGSPLAARTFTVFGNTIADVPVVNSTNSSIFMTGILWDSSDDSNNNNQYDNVSKEDVVFVALVNKSKQGMYGTYDYEIRVPASLKDYKAPDQLTVTFYTEIK